jgi:hypothetical protein
MTSSVQTVRGLWNGVPQTMFVWKYNDYQAPRDKPKLFWRYRPEILVLHAMSGVFLCRLYYSTPRALTYNKVCHIYDYWLSCTPRDVFYAACERHNEAAERNEMGGHDFLEKARVCRLLRCFVQLQSVLALMSLIWNCRSDFPPELCTSTLFVQHGSEAREQRALERFRAQMC